MQRACNFVPERVQLPTAPQLCIVGPSTSTVFAAIRFLEVGTSRCPPTAWRRLCPETTGIRRGPASNRVRVLSPSPQPQLSPTPPASSPRSGASSSEIANSMSLLWMVCGGRTVLRGVCHLQSSMRRLVPFESLTLAWLHCHGSTVVARFVRSFIVSKA